MVGIKMSKYKFKFDLISTASLMKGEYEECLKRSHEDHKIDELPEIKYFDFSAYSYCTA